MAGHWPERCARSGGEAMSVCPQPLLSDLCVWSSPGHCACASVCVPSGLGSLTVGAVPGTGEKQRSMDEVISSLSESMKRRAEVTFPLCCFKFYIPVMMGSIEFLCTPVQIEEKFIQHVFRNT